MEDKSEMCDLQQREPVEDSDDASQFDLLGFMKSEINRGKFVDINPSGIEECVINFQDLEFSTKIAGGSTCEVFRGEYKGLDVGKKYC